MVDIYNYGSMWQPNGYYPIVGDHILGIVYCAECADNGDRAGAALAGDDWEPISYHHETDYPVHCDPCTALVVTTLTKEGREYVAERLALHEGQPFVLAAWAMVWPELKPGADQ